MPDTPIDPFESLIAPHLARLFRAAYRLAGNRSDAEDLVQDTCMQACENPAALDAARHPERWLLRVLYNRFIDGTRRPERSRVVPFTAESEAAVLASREHNPERLALQAETEVEFERACGKLQPTHRALLTLRAEGFGLAEIEEITGIGRDVLRARLHRARLNLAQYLEAQKNEAEILTRLGSGQ